MDGALPTVDIFRQWIYNVRRGNPTAIRLNFPVHRQLAVKETVVQPPALARKVGQF